MEGEAKRHELQSLLEAIKESDVSEKRVSLLNQIEGSLESATDNLVLLVEHLIGFWEESACLGVSNCMLNKIILQIAIKCMEIDTNSSLSQILILSSKASSWCEKYIKDINESETIFQEILFDAMNFATSLISILTSSPISNNDINLMLIIENFIYELLNLTKSSIINNKKIPSQVILEGIKTLCIKCRETPQKDKTNREEYSNILSKITTHAIQTLYELGTFAASAGGAHVTLLNISWKGVVTLLSNNKGYFLEEKINVGQIVKTLISLSLEILKSAYGTWIFSDILNILEAKRAFLPIKFYLINAVRICANFPKEGVVIYKDILRFILVVNNLGFCFSKETKLKTASEALVEFVGPTSFLLLQTVLNLNNSDSNSISKFGIFEWLFETRQEIDMLKMESSEYLNFIFGTDFDAPLSGRVILYLNLLRNSQSLSESVLIELYKNLDNFFNILINEGIYPFILGLEIPVLNNSKGSVTNTSGITWIPLYNFTIQSLKTFIISANGFIFLDLETIFLENIFHPHFLVLEISSEILCFIIRNSENALKNQIIDDILSLLKLVNAPIDDLRRIGRIFNVILSYVGPEIFDRVYNIISSDEFNNIFLVLLMEGFPFEKLSDNVKTIAIKRLFNAFNAFVEGYFAQNEGSNLNFNQFHVHALAYTLQFCNIKDYDMLEEKAIHLLFKFASAIINSYKNAPNNITKTSLAKLIGSILDIISAIKFLYNYHEMTNLITKLHSIFIPNSNPNLLHNYKPSLARFISNLSHFSIPEEENNNICANIWDMNHVLLRERNFALVHLAISSFGYFAARTSCTQLWRFVPDNAALSYDLETGIVPDENRFMSELKTFLEKENALNINMAFCEEEIEFLKNEGTLINNNNNKIEICEERESGFKRKRKVLEGISEGVDLLKSGLKVMKNKIDLNDLGDIKGEFCSHIACIEDVVSHLVYLSNEH